VETSVGANKEGEREMNRNDALAKTRDTLNYLRAVGHGGVDALEKVLQYAEYTVNLINSVESSSPWRMWTKEDLK
jgi:hypothetical protein